MNPIENAYSYGFYVKCAEHGVPKDVAAGLLAVTVKAAADDSEYSTDKPVTDAAGTKDPAGDKGWFGNLIETAKTQLSNGWEATKDQASKGWEATKGWATKNPWTAGAVGVGTAGLVTAAIVAAVEKNRKKKREEEERKYRYARGR